MATRKKAALGTLWGTLERATTQGVSFVVVALLARLLGPQNYGLVTLAATIALLAQTLIGDTFSQALIQAETIEAAHIWSVFWMLVAASLAASYGLFAESTRLADLFGQPEMAPLLRALVPLLPLTAIQAVPAALFKRELDFRSLAIASTGGTLIGGATGVALAFAGFGPWSLIANLLVQNLVATIAIWRRSELKVAFHFSPRHLAQLWSFGQYSFLLAITSFLANQSPRILVGYLFGTQALGIFSLGLRIVEMMYQLLALPAANVAVSLIARVRFEPERLERAVLSATQLCGSVAIPAFVGLALLAPVLIPLVFGARWTESILIVQLLALSGVVGTIGFVSLAIITGLGRPQVNLAVSAVSALASVLVILATAPWGIVAATIFFILRGYLMSPVLVLLVGRYSGVRAVTLAGVYGPILLATVPMAIVVEATLIWLGNLAPAYLVLLAIAAGAASYGLGLLLFARPTLRLGASLFGDITRREEVA